MKSKVFTMLLILTCCCISLPACERIKEWRGGNADEFSGTLEATRINVRAEVGGKAISLPVAEGTKVEAEQIICELDTEKLDLQARAARAQLTAQKAVFEAMEKGARVQEIEQVRLLASQAREQKDKALRDFQKMEKLYHKGSISEQEYQDVQTMLKIARERYQQAQAGYQMVLEGVRDEEIRAQAAAVDGAAARLALAQTQLKDAHILSPLSGTLSELYVETGELVMAGSLVATVADYSQMELKVYLAEARLGRVFLDQPVEVFIDSYPGRAFKGRVSQIAEQAEFTPKNIQTKSERTTLVFEVTIQVQNPDGSLKAGLPADAIFVEQKK